MAAHGEPRAVGQGAAVAEESRGCAMCDLDADLALTRFSFVLVTSQKPLQLAPGLYIVIPCTFYPKTQGRFLLTCISKVCSSCVVHARSLSLISSHIISLCR